MNDITIQDLTPGQEVLYFLKPHDKTPHLITTVLGTDEDERGRQSVLLNGLSWVPVYHVRLLPEDPALVKQHGAGIPGPHIIEPLSCE